MSSGLSTLDFNNIKWTNENSLVITILNERYFLTTSKINDEISIKNISRKSVWLKRMKRETADWEKLLAKNIPDKGLVSQTYK